MINVPRWVTAGPAWVLATYTVGFAVTGAPSDTHLAPDLLALALFVAGFVATLPRYLAVWAEVGVDLICVALPLLVTLGLDPHGNYSAGGWYVSAVACLAIRLILHRRARSAYVVLAALTVHTAVWAGLEGLVGFGIFAVDLLVGVGAVCTWAVSRTEVQMAHFHSVEQAAASARAAQDAYQQEREVRLLRVASVAAAALRHIVDRGGRLDGPDRLECRLLEQTIRDENRGGALLNDRVRGSVLAARRRGATVQVIDDGGLEDLSEDAAEHLRDRIADAIAPLTSSRIIIRTNAKAGSLVTIVATTMDPTAAALGLDDDETVDLWLTLDASGVPA